MAVWLCGEALLFLLLAPPLTALQDMEPPLGSGDESEQAEPGLNAPEPTALIFGECTVTCGIGIQEVQSTSGCPGKEEKCIVGVKECRGPANCGWGRPISENSTNVMMSCIYISPENRFRYVWKILIPGKPARMLSDDSAVVVVRRGMRSVTYQCETRENGSKIASVKYAVNATTGLKIKKAKGNVKEHDPRRGRADAILIFSVVTAVLLTIVVIIIVILIILHWVLVKAGLESKYGQGDKYKKLTDRSSVNTLE